MKDDTINLYDLLVELSGLDRKIIDQELGRLIKNLDLNPDNLSTDDIRRIATLYLYEFQSSAQLDIKVMEDTLLGQNPLECQAEA